MLAAFGRRRLQRIAVQPLPHVEIVELLVPQHPGKGLALDAAHVLVVDAFLPGGVEEVGLGDALAEDVVKVGEGRPLRCSPARSRTRTVTLPRAGTVRR